MTSSPSTAGPGLFVSKWRSEGPVSLEVLCEWKEAMMMQSWLAIAEAALFLDAAELLEKIQPLLTPGESAVLGLVRRRWLGDTHLDDAIESALAIVRSAETRDLVLEGRLRMERGLIRFEAGDMDGAEEDLTWAETRLKSVAKASRDHDLSLLNKAAYHLAKGEALMALQVYGDISRTGGHAHETIAISRLGASRIRSSLGHEFDAARHAWNAHKHAMLSGQHMLAIEAGTLFIDVACSHMTEDAEPMHQQVETAQPIEADGERPILRVHQNDINGVFDWCMDHLDPGYGGPERPDLRALMTLAHRMDKMDVFSDLLLRPDLVDDPMLAAVAQACATNEAQTNAWSQRLAELTLLDA